MKVKEQKLHCWECTKAFGLTMPEIKEQFPFYKKAQYESHIWAFFNLLTINGFLHK